MRKVVVMGGSGFIGANLVRELAASFDLVISFDRITSSGPSHPNVRFAKVDLATKAFWQSPELKSALNGAEAVINLCGRTSHLESMERPIQDLRDNLLPHIYLLEAVKGQSRPPRVLYSSTRQVYGNVNRNPVDESFPITPVDTNGIHKVAAEEYSRIYASLHGIPITNLRLSNVYGPYMDIENGNKMFLGSWIRAARANEPIRIFGDGCLKRDLVYSSDVVEVILRAIDSPENDLLTLNIGGPTPLTLLEIAEVLRTFFPKLLIEMVPFPNELSQIAVGDFWTDNSLAFTRLGWKPRVNLQQGLETMLRASTTERSA